MGSLINEEAKALDKLRLEDCRDAGAEFNGYSETARFSAVLSNLNLDAVRELCVSTRKSVSFSDHREAFIEPITVEPPVFGSYHALFPVQFHDGIRWILKVPECGTPEQFNISAASALRSEASTMRLTVLTHVTNATI
jgi:hypothetical protein